MRNLCDFLAALVPTLKMKIRKMAVFLLKKGLFRTLPPFFTLLKGENSHFFNFHFEGGYHRMSKNCKNFAHYNSDRANDALFLRLFPLLWPNPFGRPRQPKLAKLSLEVVEFDKEKGITGIGKPIRLHQNFYTNAYKKKKIATVAQIRLRQSSLNPLHVFEI